MEHLKFCYEKQKSFSKKTLSSGATYAVALKGKYWDSGLALKIHFINGDAYQISSMKTVIMEMMDYTSLSPEYTSNPATSDIRISFNYGSGSYSYLGTDAKFIPTDQETLNIGWSGIGVMRHEFGHALNLSHEHQNPLGGIQWNEAKVIEDLSGPPNYWTGDQIRHNVLDAYNINDVDVTQFDMDSIMLYYFPNEWTIGDFQTNNNEELSEVDQNFLRRHYPEVDIIAPVITLNGDDQISLGFGSEYTEQGATALDNKDGDISNKIRITGTVDTHDPGIHPIIYSVQDNAGNYTEKIRNVLVNEEDITTEPSDPETGDNGNKKITLMIAAVIIMLIIFCIFFFG